MSARKGLTNPRYRSPYYQKEAFGLADQHALDDADREALEQAYRRVGANLWRAILAYAGGAREVADDAVAEAFAQAGRRLHGIRDVEGWVFATAFRIAAGELKRRRSESTIEHGSLRTQEHSPGEITELMLLVQKLGRTQREVFILRDVLGYSSKETARLLGRSDGAVRVHLVAARRHLREYLEEVDSHA
jgi:RNA polymerase sigma-70 factor (ECF subfamily)